MTKTKYILVGGYPRRANDGGRGFTEELVRGFDAPVKIMECLFARPKEEWQKAYQEDVEFFTTMLSDKKLEFQLADPETFIEQVRWANAIYIRGGASESAAMQLLEQSGEWRKELPGKTLAGSSAGAYIMSKYYYDIDNPAVKEGLGILQLKTIVHFKSDYNTPNIDWDKAVVDLSAHKETLPVVTLAEGQFEVYN